MTSTQFAAALVSAGAGILTIGGAAFVVAFLVQITKGILNKIPGVTSGTKGQNQVVRAYALFVALVVVMGDAALNYALNSRIDVANDISASINVALVAIATYHIVTSDAIPSFPLPAVSLSTSPSIPAPVEPPPKVKGKAVPGSANSVITAPATQTE